MFDMCAPLTAGNRHLAKDHHLTCVLGASRSGLYSSLCGVFFMLFCSFLSFWFRVCSFFGRGLGSVLAFPFFHSLVPPCWSPVFGACGFVRWRRCWPPCCRGLSRFGFSGSWFCVPVSSFSVLWRVPLGRPGCVWAAFPAVVSRRGGVVFSVWVFLAQGEKTKTVGSFPRVAAAAFAPPLAA